MATPTAILALILSMLGIQNVVSRIRSVLECEQMLQQDESIWSANGKFELRLQSDGNLVLYESIEGQERRVIWATNTERQGRGPYLLKMQSDGNLVLSDSQSRVWASNTGGNRCSRCVLQDNGILEVYTAAGQLTWTSQVFLPRFYTFPALSPCVVQHPVHTR